MMIKTTYFYMVISVCLTMTFIQDHRSARTQKNKTKTNKQKKKKHPKIKTTFAPNDLTRTAIDLSRVRYPVGWV